VAPLAGSIVVLVLVTVVVVPPEVVVPEAATVAASASGCSRTLAWSPPCRAHDMRGTWGRGGGAGAAGTAGRRCRGWDEAVNAAAATFLLLWRHNGHRLECSWSAGQNYGLTITSKPSISDGISHQSPFGACLHVIMYASVHCHGSAR
jgi:hypothetical protein